MNSKRKQNEILKISEGENHWGYTADLYLSNSTWIDVADKKYGTGAAKFICDALKFYSKNNM
jgi:hypothetical protein